MGISENELVRMYDDLQKEQSNLLLDLKNIKQDENSHKVEANIQKQISIITQLLCSLLKLKTLKKNKLSFVFGNRIYEYTCSSRPTEVSDTLFVYS